MLRQHVVRGGDHALQAFDMQQSRRRQCASSLGHSEDACRGAQRVRDIAHRIVVVGGGPGGVWLGTRPGGRLGKAGKAHVPLIDRRRTHLWKPLLHEIAAGSMDLGTHEIDYLAQAYWHGFTFRLGALIGIDRGRRMVRVAPYIDSEGREVTPAREFGYDTLVIAIGSLTNDFGTRGVKAHAIPL